MHNMTHTDIARHLKTEVCFNLWSFGTSQLSYASLDSRRFKKQYLIGSGPVMKGRRTLAVFFSVSRQKSFTCRLVFVEFRQVDDKIGACRAISDSARSQNVLSIGPCRLVFVGSRSFFGARVYLS